MTARGRVQAVLLALALAAAAGRTLTAHQLDEYLQAALVSIGRDRVGVELSLTPGVAIAPIVIAAIDRDGDAAISTDEARAYVRDVMAGLTLDVDGRARDLTPATHRFPTIAEMREGTGAIRIRAVAPIDSAAAGRHEVRLRNAHRPDLGVYLANALAPTDAAIRIARQQRDVDQRELRIDFVVDGATSLWPTVASAAAATLLTFLFFWRVRYARAIRAGRRVHV